jgi:glycine/D-amino acid oxidase-like deaminating enzyme
VIGAGLAGTSAAYHVSKLAPHMRVVILDSKYPCAEASGRNGGNFEIMSEAHFGCYDGAIQERLEWLQLLHPRAKKHELQKLAERQVSVLHAFTSENNRMMESMIRNEHIECDYSPAGWLRVASSKDEELAFQSDQFRTRKFDPSELQIRWGISTTHAGELMKNSGNYHPFKFVCKLLQTCLRRGHTSLFTNTHVQSVKTQQDGQVLVKVRTGHEILCSKVIVATNAFTPALFPDKLDEIECTPSQIATWEHITDRLNGITVTESEGDIYYNFPGSTRYKDPNTGSRRGMLNYGLDWMNKEEVQAVKRSKVIFDETVKLVNARFPETVGQPPSRAWAGCMGITIDRIPMVGFYHPNHSTVESRFNNIVMAAAFQGFGGSYCVLSGFIAAYMALTGEQHVLAPTDMFSPDRFQNWSQSRKEKLKQAVNDLGISCHPSRPQPQR